MVLSLTNEQRLGLGNLFAKQQPKKLKEQLINYDVFKKIDLDEDLKKTCFKYEDKKDVDRITGVNKSIMNTTSDLNFEKAEVRAIKDLLLVSEIGVSDVSWAGSLFDICEKLLDAKESETV